MNRGDENSREPHRLELEARNKKLRAALEQKEATLEQNDIEKKGLVEQLQSVRTELEGRLEAMKQKYNSSAEQAVQLKNAKEANAQLVHKQNSLQ